MLKAAYDRLCKTADFTSRVHVSCIGIHELGITIFLPQRMLGCIVIGA